MNDSTYRIPESVVADTLAFRQEVTRHINGETTAVAFRAIRVPMGIYEQRENDTYMVRIRGAAGVFLPHQLKRVAALSEEFGNGIIHVTTRQDLQIHSVLLENLPTILEKLLEAGLSSRGGGGNTVRNISACPSAGVCAEETFDVTPYALALTEYLVRERANFNLPRKFKAAFSGCSKDCGLASVADLGFFAHVKDNVHGFAVYAGGGMGAHSALAIRIEEFVPGEAVFEVAEAVKRLFDKHGDRANRSRARLRYVVERVGAEEFTRLYREELEQVRRDGITVPVIQLSATEIEGTSTTSEDKAGDDEYLRWKRANVSAQKQAGLYEVWLRLPLGDIRAASLLALVDVIEQIGDGTLRTTQDQDVCLRNVPASSLYALFETLKKIDPAFVSVLQIRTVACAGASTCKLGLCLSRGLAKALDEALTEGDISIDAPVRISGCPNSCGQHKISPVGLYGGARRVNGRLAPYYTIVTGGRVAEGNARLAQQTTRVPARALPSLFKEFHAAVAEQKQPGETFGELIERWGAEYLGTLGQKYETVPSYEDAPEFYRDFGSSEDFSLAGRGPGECGAGVLDIIALDIDAAKQALAERRLYDAVIAASRALLVTKGLEPKKDIEIFNAFTEHLINPGWVSCNTKELVEAAIDFKMGGRESLDDLRDTIQALLDRIEQLFHSLDANLAFRIAPIQDVQQTQETSQKELSELDLRGVACPLNFARAKVELEMLDTGEEMQFLLDDGDPVRNVTASFADLGEEIIEVTQEGNYHRVTVRKRT